MVKLRQLPPLISLLPPQLGYEQGGRDQYRDATQHWRKWYKTKRWQKLRWAVLVRDRFTCQICGRIEPETSQLRGDHRIPHRGREELFFDGRNVWTLCQPCHDGEKQRQEKDPRFDDRADRNDEGGRPRVEDRQARPSLRGSGR